MRGLILLTVCRIGNHSGRCWQSQGYLWACHWAAQTRHARGALEGIHWLWDWARGIWPHAAALQALVAEDTARQGLLLFTPNSAHVYLLMPCATMNSSSGSNLMSEIFFVGGFGTVCSAGWVIWPRSLRCDDYMLYVSSGHSKPHGFLFARRILAFMRRNMPGPEALCCLLLDNFTSLMVSTCKFPCSEQLPVFLHLRLTWSIGREVHELWVQLIEM